MHRRTFFTTLGIWLAQAGAFAASPAAAGVLRSAFRPAGSLGSSPAGPQRIEAPARSAAPAPTAPLAGPPPQHQPEDQPDSMAAYLDKMRNFDRDHPDDICLGRADLALLESSVARLRRLQRTVGHGNFHLLGFDQALTYARNYPKVGDFSKEELGFLERIFYADAARYGFFGEKPLARLTQTIRTRTVRKVPGSGNYLYRGEPLATLAAVHKAVGPEVQLTSGVRSVMKQFLLFLEKARTHGGNLSLASRSLAPPGYSFHGVGDFDVGQRGLGAANFTARFAETEVFRRLREHGFVRLRYPQDNTLGVRFEPWHIKVGKAA